MTLPTSEYLAKIRRYFDRPEDVIITPLVSAQLRAYGRELLDALAAVTADRNEVERLFKESENVREDLDAKWEAAQASADRLETESNGRLTTLLEKAEEARREWQRAENAEGKTDRLEQQLAEAKSDVEHWEHSSEYAGTLLKQAGAKLATLKDKLRVLADEIMADAHGTLRLDVAQKLDALLAELETAAITQTV